MGINEEKFDKFIKKFEDDIFPTIQGKDGEGIEKFRTLIEKKRSDLIMRQKAKRINQIVKGYVAKQDMKLNKNLEHQVSTINFEPKVNKKIESNVLEEIYSGLESFKGFLSTNHKKIGFTYIESSVKVPDYNSSNDDSFERSEAQGREYFNTHNNIVDEEFQSSSFDSYEVSKRYKMKMAM